jgi:hypothetical protein
MGAPTKAVVREEWIWRGRRRMSRWYAALLDAHDNQVGWCKHQHRFYAEAFHCAEGLLAAGSKGRR